MIFRKEFIPDLEYLLNLYYYKIVRFNIHTGEYEIILSNGNSEADGATIQEWFKNFADKGNVSPAYRELYNKMTDISDLPERLTKNFCYQRKTGAGFVDCRMIFMPSRHDEDYFYVFVKEEE